MTNEIEKIVYSKKLAKKQRDYQKVLDQCDKSLIKFLCK